VLQCVAVCCSVLQCVAVCCSVLQCQKGSPPGGGVLWINSILTSRTVCCSVSQCVAVCRSVLHCVAVSKGKPTRAGVSFDHVIPTSQTVLNRCLHEETSRHAATRCNTLQHAATHLYNARRKTPLQLQHHIKTRCNTLQHATTRYNTQHECYAD